MAAYRVGIIGLGNIACDYEVEEWRGHPSTHVGAYGELSNVEVVAACDAAGEKLEPFCDKWGVPASYADPVAMLDAEKPDIVSICTPHHTHAELVVAAAERGVNGIALEKPMANSLGECDRMLEACEKHGVKLSICYLRRWSHEYAEIQRMMQAGELGALKHITGHMARFKPAGWQADVAASGGFLAYDPTHLIDTVAFFAGDPEWVMAHVERRDPELNVEDLALATFRFKSGVVAQIEADAYRSTFDFSFMLGFEHGRIDFVNLCNAPAYRLMMGREHQGGWKFPELREMPAADPMNLQVEQLRELVACLESGAQPTVTGQEGRVAIELTMGLYESARRDGEKVRFPLERSDNPLAAMLAEGKL